jgi:hypothetical protein
LAGKPDGRRAPADALGGDHPALPRIVEARSGVLKSLGLKAEAGEMERSAKSLRRGAGGGSSFVSIARLWRAAEKQRQARQAGRRRVRGRRREIAGRCGRKGVLYGRPGPGGSGEE